MWTVMTFEELDAELGLLSALCLGSSGTSAHTHGQTALRSAADRVRPLVTSGRRALSATDLAALFREMTSDELAALEERCAEARKRLALIVQDLGGGVRHAANIVVRRSAASRLVCLLEEGAIEMLVLRAGDVPKVHL